ncbi:DUF6350 family protein [Tamaricihabitans halophyticus]|uniref:cell division protein PerM n=1 Tax=Tamaricihabitans halophyticus TaxID=1262583 RepID=UPI001047F809|nr:DUF6350 family protein [Tamaricihabitans halophyticus]
MPLAQPVDLDAPEDTPAVPASSRVRVFAMAAVLPLVTGYAAVAALLALVTAIASNSHFATSGVLLAAVPGWLAVHQVPISILGHPLSVLPLLPTILLAMFIARAAGAAADRLGLRTPRQAIPLVATFAGAHAGCGFLLAMLVSGSDLDSSPLLGMLVPGGIAAVAATVPLARRCGIFARLRVWLDETAPRGLRAGLVGISGLVAVGTLTYLLGIALAFPTVRQLFTEQADGFGSGLGMLLLSVAYVPNAVLGATSFALGPGITLGSAHIGMFEFSGGPVPALPILAALPEQQAQWWPVFLLAPAAVGALVGWMCRKAAPRPFDRLRMVIVAGAVTALGWVLLGSLAGGSLAGGPFDPVRVPADLVSVAAFLSIVLPGGLLAWFAGERPARSGAPAQEMTDEQEEQEEQEDLAESDELDASDEPGELDETGEVDEGDELEDHDELEEPEEHDEPEEHEEPIASARLETEWDEDAWDDAEWEAYLDPSDDGGLDPSDDGDTEGVQEDTERTPGGQPKPGNRTD